jgi:hypothetical protein
MVYKDLYPDMFDDSDFDLWKSRNIRKEFLSYEWNMMVQEVAPDVFEFPFFNTKFCDNLVEILKSINWDQVNRWGTPVFSTNLKKFNLEKIMTHLVHDYIFSIVQKEWHLEGKKWKLLQPDNNVLKLQQGQEIRAHHDDVHISMYCKLDDNSEGGDLVFEKYGKTIVPKQGYIYMYPGQITHRYGMKRVDKNDRYFLMTYCTSD